MGNVLVLGGTAWLGHEIARVAVDREHEVTCLARGASGGTPAGARLVRADRGEPGAYAEVADTRWDAVFDVSWQPGQVRHAVRELGSTASHWTYVSSISVYGEDGALLEPYDGDTATLEQYGEAKVACEQAVSRLDDVLVARAGLIGGPGDRSDRFGYWPSRFALAGDGPVLVPSSGDQPTQTIDVRDLAHWLVVCSEKCVRGTFDAVGEQTSLGDVLELAAAAAGFAGESVAADDAWLESHDMHPWAGERSLPLWLPGHDAHGSHDDTAALDAGLRRRPVLDTLRDVLADEQERGLDRDRKAGLSRADELELIGRLRG